MFTSSSPLVHLSHLSDIVLLSFQLGECAHPAVEVLVQHVALRVPERAEFRLRASLAVVELMRGLPDNVARRIVHWFFR